VDAEPTRTEPPDQALASARVPGQPPDGDAPALARKLGLFDITMLVMGSVIGVGIFAVPHTVAGLLQSPGLVLAAWALGGLVTLAGSLVYAELTRRRPHVGGQYAFLREAYHPAVAFVYGWSLLWIVQSGGMASVAVIFGRYFLELVSLVGEGSGGAVVESLRAWVGAPGAEAVVAAAAIATLTAVNCTGVRAGSTAQNIFMVLKILAILLLVGCGLLLVEAGWIGLGGVPAPSAAGAPGKGAAAAGGWQLLTAFAAAMVPVLFSYGGSHTTTFMAGEVCDPRRNLPRGLVLGVLGVVVLYVAVNFVCLRALGVERLAATERPAAAVMGLALGAPGAAVISAGIAISALGFLSQAVLTSPRVYYAMARDGLFFQGIAWVHPRTRAPVLAIVLQGAFAMVIAVSGTFEQILNYVMSVEMVFLALTALSLFVLRRRDATAADTVPGHPVTTVLFAVVNVTLVLDLFYKYPRNSAMGIGIALASVPVYFAWRLWGRRGTTSRPPGP
jgi:APA family basic amino acid/polyamine antiporter